MAVENTIVNTTKPLLSGRQYDYFRNVLHYILPGISATGFTGAQFWEIPNIEQIIGTSAIVMLILSLFLRYSKRSYTASDYRYDGTIKLEQDSNEKKIFSMEFNSDPHDFDQKKQVVFKVTSKYVSAS